jgi:hypothetical protein
MSIEDLSDWGFPTLDTDGWTISYTRPSEAVDLYRISEDDASKLAHALGATMADVRSGADFAVKAWNRATVGEEHQDRLLVLGIILKHYAEWIPGGDYGYYLEVDEDGNYVEDHDGGSVSESTG